MMSSQEIREKFLKFFEAREHVRVPSSSLLPDDPSVLFTTAGMQQFKPYFIGKADPLKDFGGRNTTSSQKSFRTSDIDEVGDERHLTFFEMLGNFSFGGYFKQEAIQYAHDFIKELGLAIDYVTIFGGDKEVPADIESEKYWKELGIPPEKIRKMGREDNFWGPTGNEGPCGPTTEIYVKPNSNAEAIEIWNVVFNEYYSFPDKHLEKLKTPGIDTGMGLERLTAVVQKVPTVFDTDLFQDPFKEIFKTIPGDIRSKRIVADHLRASVFLLADGIRPSNKDRGYVLRRLIRRLYIHSKRLGSILTVEDLKGNIDKIIEKYTKAYPELTRQSKIIKDEFTKEVSRFSITLEKAIKELKSKDTALDGKRIFYLYQTYGLPIEATQEILTEWGRPLDSLTLQNAQEEFKKHQEVSRAGVEKKFGGHGLILDTGELKAGSPEELQKVTRLHSATHLLHAALRKVLGDTVHQMGSDITNERLRFDFTFDRKLTDAEKQAVEQYVNDAIDADVAVVRKEMPFEEAVASGALAFFRGKYPPVVSTYEFPGWSKEVCGGPHVEHTKIIGKFKIIKDEASSAGVRRIRATVE